MCGHTFTYSPPVRAVKRMLDAGELGESAFHLLQPRQPRPAPARRERDLGPRSPRLLHPSLLAGRDAGDGRRLGPRRRRAGHHRRRLPHPELRLRDAREPGDELAGPEQAAPDGARRQREDGRLRGRRSGAGARVRPGRRLPRSGDLRRVPPLLPHRRHRLAAPRRSRAARGRAPGLHRLGAMPARADTTSSTWRSTWSARSRPPRLSLLDGGAPVRVEAAAAPPLVS